MNIIITFLLKKYKFPNLIFKYLPNNWTDKNGNNLYHYSCMHHDIFLFEKAKKNNAKINQLNINGMMPIHTYMGCGFPKVQREKNKEKSIKRMFKSINVNELIGLDRAHLLDLKRPEIEIDFNLDLLDLLVKEGANINEFIKSPEREGQWGEGVSTNSKKNIRGSCIELLILFFWENILHTTFYDESQIENYHKIYNKLSNYGANINLIVEDSIWDDTEVVRDAMQEINAVIVSHFFIRYIMNEKDIIAIKPILMDKNIDFNLQDHNGNTVLHYLFSRFNEREKSLGKKNILELFEIIINNSSFNKSCLEVKNGFRLDPLMNFKRDKNDLRNEFEKLLLKKSLSDKLNTKDIKVKVKKI